MKMHRQNGKVSVKLLLVVLLGIGIVYFLVTTAVNERLSDLQLETKVLITDQESKLATIAEITARNGADEITERIIKDCSVAERTDFDEKLGSLDKGLSRAELVELERLFGRCGSFFAERKAVMVSRLSREKEIFEIFVNQLSNLEGEDVSSKYRVADWSNLSELEEKQSFLFSELVSLQDEIITTLLDGKTSTSDEIVAILQKVSETQETLVVTNSQASTLRSSLVSI